MLLRELLIKYEINNQKSHSEMAALIGVSLSTYYRWMNGESTQLKKRTLNRLSELLAYDIQKVLHEQEKFKPLLGTVKAGYDLYADENITDYIELNDEDAKKGDYFLKVVGDSMEGAHIYDGDIVYVQQCDTIASGKIGVIMIGDEVTIKKVIYKQDLLILEAANPKYQSRYFTKEEVATLPVKILGAVRFVRTDFA